MRGLKNNQLNICMTTSGEKYIVYTEQRSENNPGCINSYKIQNKAIPHYRETPSRDFIHLLKKIYIKMPR